MNETDNLLALFDDMSKNLQPNEMFHWNYVYKDFDKFDIDLQRLYSTFKNTHKNFDMGVMDDLNHIITFTIVNDLYRIRKKKIISILYPRQYFY